MRYEGRKYGHKRKPEAKKERGLVGNSKQASPDVVCLMEKKGEERKERRVLTSPKKIL